MHVVAAVAALLLLLVVLSPVIGRRFRLARRERAVHLDGGCHWYANYDEDLRYEPHSGADIVRLRRDDVLRRGFKPTNDVQIVPRTFRNRVPGDAKIRLWKTTGPEAQHLWLCEWAMSPVRVAIGVGDRERVPGVESGHVPTHPESRLAPSPAAGEERWSLGSAGSSRSTDDSMTEARIEAARVDIAGGVAASEDATADDGVPADADSSDAPDSSESANDEAPVAESNPPVTTEDASSGRERSRRKRRRKR